MPATAELHRRGGYSFPAAVLRMAGVRQTGAKDTASLSFVNMTFGQKNNEINYIKLFQFISIVGKESKQYISPQLV
jgi:hypothetical protein